ncbi:rhomboid family intramembrane serine protease [Blattabacterium cuenoti]|uniref:rhomboid family intramembrane serine protease n=1 Tax=Blattabacterium cuenoti TaxID=1653831 RepID=UPI00163C441A|nr:rhomboid family intramembrane serine protease [Blattabacterium cuenoti]
MNFYTNFNYNSNAVKHLISINILVYTAIYVFPQYRMENIFSLYHPLYDKFHIYQIFTHMFIHSKNLFLHIIFNMLALFMFGGQIESLLGFKKFIILYFLSGIIAAFIQILFNTILIFYFIETLNIYKINNIINYLSEEKKILIYNSLYSPMMGASGAISGIVGAFARIFPEHKIFILPFPFPIKVRKALLIFVFGSFISTIFNISPGVAHFAHIGGILSGYFIGSLFLRKIFY